MLKKTNFYLNKTFLKVHLTYKTNNNNNNTFYIKKHSRMLNLDEQDLIYIHK